MIKQKYHFSSNMFNGTAYWKVIHFLAVHNVGRSLLQQLHGFIGCQTCKTKYIPPSETENLLEWSINLHNAVNSHLAKPAWSGTISTHCEHCDPAKAGETPWVFMHNVAETGGNDAISFLKDFNQIYPCTKCQNNLLNDDLLENEKCLYWTFRNRKRLNDQYNRQPFIYEMDSPLNNASFSCQGCPIETQAIM